VKLTARQLQTHGLFKISSGKPGHRLTEEKESAEDNDGFTTAVAEIKEDTSARVVVMSGRTQSARSAASYNANQSRLHIT
jgi:hypothetical protein